MRVIAIGSSLGGLDALGTIFSELPKDFPYPLAVVQHRSKDTLSPLKSPEGLLPQLLNRKSHLNVIEVEDKQKIQAGCIYLAPSDYHLLLEEGYFSLSIDPAVHHARPSIDVFFESCSDVLGSESVGVILTGSNRDGAEGILKIFRNGGCVIVEDPKTAEQPEMPEAALEALRTDSKDGRRNRFQILPLKKIASFLRGIGKKDHDQTPKVLLRE